jgi:hypothetical protein
MSAAEINMPDESHMEYFDSEKKINQFLSFCEKSDEKSPLNLLRNV